MSESKTPQFDARLDDILNNLFPHSRVCSDCQKEFQIEEGDITFYKMFRVPPPKLCPACRERQRISFSNYSNIYKRACSAPGHTDLMISPVAPAMPWITYDHETYYGDTWNPLSYGKEIEAGRSFLDQLLDLLKIVPQPGVRRGANSPNSDFCFYGKDMKDCYYVFGGRRSEDVMYSASIYDSRCVADSYFVKKVDMVYNGIRVTDSYNIKHAYFSSSCVDCNFIFDCRNCQNCFGCVNLRNKNYCWFNEQLSKNEYEKRVAGVDLGSRKVAEESRQKFWEMVKANPIRATRIYQSQNVSGDDIIKSNNCQKCFQVEDGDNLRYASFCVMNLKDSMDVSHSGGKSEKIYFCQNTGTHSSNIKFSHSVKESLDCEYVMTCLNCRNCFGCIGLRNASYVIFNKQYNQSEYWPRVDEIKSEMLRQGNYGEFFPMSFSPVAYNSSFANIVYPMKEEEARSRGLFWQPDLDTDIKNLKGVFASDLPDNIRDVTDKICDMAVIGEVSKKPFRLTGREVEFYKRYGIALPADTPYQRMIERFRILNNFKTSPEKCLSCTLPIDSVYKVSDGYRPYCEKCFQAEVL